MFIYITQTVKTPKSNNSSTLPRFPLCFFLTTKVIIRDDLGQVEGIAVEWESGLIYWTDYIYERIEVARLDGSSRKTLFTSSLFYPRGIAVDPKSG